MSPIGNENRQPPARPSVAKMQHAAPGPSGKGESTLMTRRRFLYGAIGAGAVAAVGIGAAVYSGSADSGDSSVPYLDVPEHALSTLNDFEALDNTDGMIQQVGEIDLPYGTLVWASDESVAACLLPTESGSPLAQVGLIFLGSGSYDTVLEKAIGTTEGFEIYDVRANSNGIIWTEANILQETWRVYAAALSSGTMRNPILLEEGNSTYETPTLAACGTHALWLANPRANEAIAPQDAPNARLMKATFGKEGGAVLFESSRRMSTPPYSYGSTVTIAPRAESASTYYQLTNIDVDSGEVRDTATLPHAIIPTEAGYGDTGFMFSFPDIYNYDGAIANLGTYAPRQKPEGGDYNAAPWFNFTRTPTAAPAWCNGLLIVKSTYAVCGVDLDTGSYCAIDVENGADTYGEYLASTGSASTFVTYTNIDHTPVGAERIYACRVKVWTTV